MRNKVEFARQADKKGKSGSSREKTGKPQLSLREEIARLDLGLLSFIELRQRLAAICAQEKAFAPILKIWRESSEVLANASPLNQRLFDLLESSSFATHGQDDREQARWTEHLRRTDAQESLDELDNRILRDIAKRARLLGKMSQGGHISTADEKFLRENWQKEVARLQGNATVSGPLFMCIQGFAPTGSTSASEKVAAQPYTLYSAPGPVHFCMTAPLDDFASRAWLYLAAATGQPMNLCPIAQNDPLSDLLHILTQIGASAELEEDTLHAKASAPLGRPDRVAHAGGDVFNLYLLVCHYLGAGSRIKITGDTSLQLMNFSFLRRILPELGARIVHMVPKNSGLPLRLECSGILPPVFAVLPELPRAFVEALLLCAPFYRQPFAVDLSACPERGRIADSLLPIFEQAGIACNLAGHVFNFTPDPVLLPEKPNLPVDCRLSLFLLAIAQACSGEVELAGSWPLPGAEIPQPEVLMKAGIEWSRTEYGMRSVSAGKPATLDLENVDLTSFADDSFAQALLCCLAAITALKGGRARLPRKLAAIAQKNGFWAAVGLGALKDGFLAKEENIMGCWKAPDAWWAMALGLAALVKSWRGKICLGNPAIVRQKWTPFWQLLNSVTMPSRSMPEKAPAVEKKSRRIHTQAVAVPPQIREEDWER